MRPFPGPGAVVYPSELEELRHRRVKAIALVGIDDVGIHSDRHLATLEQGHQWRLMRDKRLDMLWVSDDPVQGAHPAPA
jgi:hypothetical protein